MPYLWSVCLGFSLPVSHGCKMAAVPEVSHPHTTQEHSKLEGREQGENSLFPGRAFLFLFSSFIEK